MLKTFKEEGTPDKGLFISGYNRIDLVRLDLRDTADELQTITMRKIHRRNKIRIELQNSAWHSRGWVFQERQLSRRCIFFTTERVYWRCNQYWEDEQTGPITHREQRSIPSILTDQLHREDDWDLPHKVRVFWEGYVQDYSATELTFISDKDKAIQGMMEQLKTRFAVTFRWGIFDLGARSNLLRQLLWHTAITNRRVGRSSRPFLCPSWSWMSVDCPVTWTIDDYLSAAEPLATIRFSDDGSDKEYMKLFISGPARTISYGSSVSDLARRSNFERWHPDLHFGDNVTMMDESTTRILLDDQHRTIGWVVLEDASDPCDLVAIAFQQCFRLDDEEEPLCIDFLALRMLDGTSCGSKLASSAVYHRIGIGRVLKDAFGWLNACVQHEVIVA